MILDYGNGQRYFSFGFWECWSNGYYQIPEGGSAGYPRREERPKIWDDEDIMDVMMMATEMGLWD